MDFHVDDTCTKRLLCGASGRMHESDKGHPSDSSSSELTDEAVNTVKNRRMGKRKKKNKSCLAKKAKKRNAQANETKETKETVADKKSLWQQSWG